MIPLLPSYLLQNFSMVGCAMLAERQSCYFHFLDDELKHGEVATCHSPRSEPLGEPDALQPMAGAREH